MRNDENIRFDRSEHILRHTHRNHRIYAHSNSIRFDCDVSIAHRLNLKFILIFRIYLNVILLCLLNLSVTSRPTDIVLYIKIEIIKRTLQTKPAHRIVKYDKIADCSFFSLSFFCHSTRDCWTRLRLKVKISFAFLPFHSSFSIFFSKEKFYERIIERTVERREKSRENHIVNSEIKCNEPETRPQPSTISSDSRYFRGIEQRLNVRWN